MVEDHTEFDAQLQQLREPDAFRPLPPAAIWALIAVGVLLVVASAAMMRWLMAGGPGWAAISIIIGAIGMAVILFALRQLSRPRQR